MRTIDKKPAGKPGAVTYEQLLTLPWYWGEDEESPYVHLLEPGYTENNGNTKYFGTDKAGKRQISVNIDYVGHTFVRIEEDCGTRCVFNGHVRSFEELKLINELVL
jgi:hypothetical protein